MNSKPPKSLDEIAIASFDSRPGYRVGDLDEARARFRELHEIDFDWGTDPDA